MRSNNGLPPQWWQVVGEQGQERAQLLLLTDSPYLNALNGRIAVGLHAYGDEQNLQRAKTVWLVSGAQRGNSIGVMPQLRRSNEKVEKVTSGHGRARGNAKFGKEKQEFLKSK